MALALYRKYRPATFAQVVGQEHVTDPLRTALAAGRVNHAYLFSGPRGCGKTSSARILARSLNCEQGPTDEPCGVCNSCVGLAPNGPGTVDVIELDAASHGGVDDARELRDKAFYSPAESRYRVFIVDEAHMVTTQGFNALLKIVEEPPEHLVFIFATTEPDKVLPTIRSRTHHYPFRLIPPTAMRALLERNCADEGVAVEPAVFPLVIRAGGGSARDTQSVLDQLLAGAGPEGVTYTRAVNLLGVTDVSLLDDIVDGLAASDGATVFGTVERVVEAGHDPRRFATDLLDRFRDLVLLQAVPDAGERGLITAPADEVTRMDDQARKLGQATVTRYAEIVHAGLTEMRGATAPRLLLELVCSRMLLPSASDTESAVLQRVERLERRLTAAAGGTPGAPGTPDAADSTAAGAPATQAAPRFQRPSQRAAEPSAAQPAAQRPAPDGGSAHGDPAHATASTPPSPEQPAEPTPARTGTPSAPADQPPAATEPATEPPPASPTGNTPAERADPAATPSPTRDTTPTPQATTRATNPSEPTTGPAESAAEPATGSAAEPATGSTTASASERAAEPTAGSAAAAESAAAAAEPAEPAAEPDQPPAASAAPAASEPPPAAPVTPAAPEAPPATDGTLDAAAIRRVWSEVLAAVRASSRSVEAMLSAATVQSVDGNIVTLTHTAAPLVKRLSEARNVDVVAAALQTAVGGQWQVRWTHGAQQPAAAQPPAPKKAPPKFEAPSRAQQPQATPAEPTTPPTPPADDGQADDEIPPPPEPMDDEDMLAEAARPMTDEERANQRTPEDAAIDLLTEHLGARKIDR